MYLENLYKIINRIFYKKSKKTITSFSQKIINRMAILIKIKIHQRIFYPRREQKKGI